ncbi:MAG TPA: archease [Nitrososphaera sp.]
MGEGYRFLDHMTDAVIEAYGSTLNEAFENAALGLSDTMIDLNTVEPKKKIKVTAKGHDLYSLLFDWLNTVLLLMVVDWIAVSQFSIEIRKQSNGYSIEGTAIGEPFDFDRHRYKIEIKGVTYHEMEIKQDTATSTVRFLVDL